MPLDAVALMALTGELRGVLTGARIEKVLQPERDEVHLLLRVGPVRNLRLLISVNPQHARVHITEIPKENPDTPPMFCMLLRKHIQGARIADIKQTPWERVMSLTLDTTDEMGVASHKTLVMELMGRHSNLILVDADGRILDCLRRVDMEMSEKRPVLPGLFYKDPPGQDKLVSADAAVWMRALQTAADAPADKWIQTTFTGLSPLMARELVYEACGQVSASLSEIDRGRFEATIRQWCAAVTEARFVPALLEGEDGPADFSYREIRQYENLYQCRAMESFSELLDTFYTQRDAREHMRTRAAALRKTIVSARDRSQRKLALRREEMRQTEGRERLRELGDVLSAHLHMIEKGMDSVTLPDFYAEDSPSLAIKLNPQLSPQQNAARYYKEHARKKSAAQHLTGQIAQAEADIQYWESVLEELERAKTRAELAEIREELASVGAVSAAASKKAAPISAPLAVLSSTGMPMLVGKNNRQNDMLTLKTADRRDTWLHTQKIPGTHVIILSGGEKPDDATLWEAAVLAATYSQASNSPKVPVDYTQVKNVKKPPGAKPGMVIYDHFQTVLAEPDAGLADKLRPYPFAFKKPVVPKKKKR